jgi:hypothetical protein
MDRSSIAGRCKALLVGVMACALGVSVAATTKGPDAGGYTATDDTTFSFVDIAGASGGVGILGGSDDVTAALQLPFTFRFYGQTYPFVCVSSNGVVYFVASEDACTGLVDFANTDLSSVAPPGDRPAVLPFWNDLTFQVAGAGSVFYQTLGTAPNRRFIVQWNDAFPQGSLTPVTFQVILNESGQTVLFQYKTVNLGAGNPESNGAHATVGIHATGGLASGKQIAWSHAAAVLGDQTAILFSATPVVGDVNGDRLVNCADVSALRAAFGKRRGQPGYSAATDLNNDGLVNVRDLTVVSRALPAGLRCP